MSRLAEKIVSPFFGKKKYYRIWNKLYKASMMGMNVGNGGDFESSGEKYAMGYVKNLLKNIDKPVLFDVGANRGDYAKELVKNYRNAEIHCFEPAAETFKILCSQGKSDKVIMNNFGMSDTCTESILYYDAECDGLASMYKRQCVEHAEPIRIKLDTVDHYCEERNIPRINLLKIDIEGNELNALHGAQRMLDEGKIDVIQMEFGGCNIDSRTYFRDFWNLLSAKYKVYRVLLDGVEEITEYGDILEIFFCTNYLFVRK